MRVGRKEDFENHVAWYDFPSGEYAANELESRSTTKYMFCLSGDATTADGNVQVADFDSFASRDYLSDSFELAGAVAAHDNA